MNFTDQRDELLESIERDQQEVKLAVQELTQAARHTISLSDHIREHPLMWLAGSVVVGMWLGRRNRPQIVIASEGDHYA